MLNMVLPLVLLSILNLFTFAIPADSGERMGYTVTVWLSFVSHIQNQLEMVQCRGVTFVSNDYQQTSSVSLVINNLGWETLQSRKAKIKTILLYQILTFISINYKKIYN
ncbi:uncharacterized protein LOC143061297 [Mytilus galloprovincialis]|uniref:uncharacterized protein LOC143061297 n=1 Tax=Mytilus galloprovincialis TaxID=29158 RepID=UPI003F7C785D